MKEELVPRVAVWQSLHSMRVRLLSYVARCALQGGRYKAESRTCVSFAWGWKIGGRGYGVWMGSAIV